MSVISVSLPMNHEPLIFHSGGQARGVKEELKRARCQLGTGLGTWWWHGVPVSPRLLGSPPSPQTQGVYPCTSSPRMKRMLKPFIGMNLKKKIVIRCASAKPVQLLDLDASTEGTALSPEGWLQAPLLSPAAQQNGLLFPPFCSGLAEKGEKSLAGSQIVSPEGEKLWVAPGQRLHPPQHQDVAVGSWGWGCPARIGAHGRAGSCLAQWGIVRPP